MMSLLSKFGGRLLGIEAPGRVGFHIDEQMAGTHTLVRALPGDLPRAEGEELPFAFRVRWGHPRISSFFNPISGDFLSARLEGEVDAGGLCQGAPCLGTIDLAYFSSQEIHYMFDFDAGGRRLRFQGEKRDIRPWNLPWSHTTCYGEVFEVTTGEAISTVLVRFSLATLIPFFRSFRLT